MQTKICNIITNHQNTVIFQMKLVCTAYNINAITIHKNVYNINATTIHKRGTVAPSYTYNSYNSSYHEATAYKNILWYQSESDLNIPNIDNIFVTSSSANRPVDCSNGVLTTPIASDGSSLDGIDEVCLTNHSQ